MSALSPLSVLTCVMVKYKITEMRVSIAVWHHSALHYTLDSLQSFCLQNLRHFVKACQISKHVNTDDTSCVGE